MGTSVRGGGRARARGVFSSEFRARGEPEGGFHSALYASWGGVARERGGGVGGAKGGLELGFELVDGGLRGVRRLREGGRLTSGGQIEFPGVGVREGRGKTPASRWERCCVCQLGTGRGCLNKKKVSSASLGVKVEIIAHALCDIGKIWGVENCC